MPVEELIIVLGISLRRGDMVNLRNGIAETIGITVPDVTSDIGYKLLESTEEDGYTRQLIEYDSCGDKVSAFLLLPEFLENNPAVLINHQHNREHHLGKSEVCGLAGNPLQAFGPELAKKGFVVLAPDSICFEERRKNPSPAYLELGAIHNLQHKRYSGGHDMTKERFDFIIEWLVSN